MISVFLDFMIVIFLADASERTETLFKFTAHNLHSIIFSRCANFDAICLNDLVSLL